MRSSTGLICALSLALCASHAQAQEVWQRSRMEQGHYAAYVRNGSGAMFRVDCGTSDDGSATPVQSLTYLPGRAVAAGRTADGTVAVDGKTFTGAFKSSDAGSDPVEIQISADDLDSLETIKDIVGKIRNGRSLSISLPAFNLQDRFGLSGAGKALGSCN